MSLNRAFRSLIYGVAVVMGTWGLSDEAKAQSLSASINTSLYGYLDQYSMNTENSFVGDEACVPTSSTNAMTMLQNLYPTVYGTSLTGSTYADWYATDNTLITSFGTTVRDGTYDNKFVNGLYNYVTVTKGFTNTVFAGQFPSNDGWDVKYPAPAWISFGEPTVDFLYNAILNGNGLLLGIDYSTSEGVDTSGGHELLANGITWDLSSQTGTISFIDPLDPSSSLQNQLPTYINGAEADPATSYDQSIGPALGTIGNLSLTSNGTLLLQYDQYDKDGVMVPNPTSSDYNTIYATIDEALSVGVVPEPSTYTLFVMGLGVFGIAAWRRRSSCLR